VGYSVCNDNDAVYRQSGICNQHVRDLDTCKVQEAKLLIDKEHECTGMNQRLALRKFNLKYTIEVSGSWFRASAITTMNKTNKMHNSFKIF
jgi:hypothetical protein